jgi:hypothetical protein
MGVLYNHGIEYIVILENGQEMKVVNVQESHDRLVKSSFYQKRRLTWFDGVHNEFKKPISTASEEFHLNPEETKKLEMILEKHPEAKHGWFDVNYLFKAHY